jgi:hypothetical protein
MLRDLEGSINKLPPEDSEFNKIVNSNITSADFPLGESRDKFIVVDGALTRETLLDKMRMVAQNYSQDGKTHEMALVNGLISELEKLPQKDESTKILSQLNRELEKITGLYTETED